MGWCDRGERAEQYESIQYKLLTHILTFIFYIEKYAWVNFSG